MEYNVTNNNLILLLKVLKTNLTMLLQAIAVCIFGHLQYIEIYCAVI